VPHRGDQRNLRSRDRPSQDFVIERRQVFRRTAAARDDDHIDIIVLVEKAHSCRHLVRSRIALHLGRIDQHIHGMMPTLEHIQNVAEGRRLGRRYNANARRQ
jgi:Mg2+ and Co2+ transporter CorA